MNSGDYIKAKFRAWAMRNDLMLQGSAGERGEPNYTITIQENIFGGHIHEDTRKAIEGGAGGELRGDIPRMSALHSSSAMGVNLFQYWTSRNDYASLARILEIPSNGITLMRFEHCCPVCDDPSTHGLKEPPHLDLGIEYGEHGRIGVECKLFEPYGRLEHQQLRRQYLDLLSTWDDIPATRKLAEQLTQSETGFHRLGAAQLVKHVLGLKFQRPTENVRLIYLYLDAIGPEAAEHRAEIDRFCGLIEADPFRFTPMSVQEFVARAVRTVRQQHREYVDYIAGRYL